MSGFVNFGSGSGSTSSYNFQFPLMVSGNTVSVKFDNSSIKSSSPNGLYAPGGGGSSLPPATGEPTDLLRNGYPNDPYWAPIDWWADLRQPMFENMAVGIGYTPPTSPLDGSAATDGFIWLETNYGTGEKLLWKKLGSDWISLQEFSHVVNWNNSSSSPNYLFSPYAGKNTYTKIYLESFRILYHILSGNSSTNYWRYKLARNISTIVSSGTLISEISSQGKANATTFNEVVALGQLLDLSATSTAALCIQHQKTDPGATLGANHGSAVVSYRLVR